MRNFYIILFALTLIGSALLYFSFWWSIGALVGILIFIAYRYYALRLETLSGVNEGMEKRMEALEIQLENAVIKEQKTSKDADQVRRMKQEMLSVLSHEVRTPMNGILGMSLLLGDTPLTKEQEMCVNTIRNCGENLLTSVNSILAHDILNFSKFQLTDNILDFKDFELRDCIEEVLQLFADQAGKAGIDLVYHINEDVPTQIIGDAKRLRQVLMNLIENALKFTQKGEIYLWIQNRGQAKPGLPPELSFEVRDSGTGIAANELTNLFKGIQVNAGQQETSSGTQGLGLVICNKLVELMGGRIDVKSKPGHGSSFTFCIPVIPSTKLSRHHLQLADTADLDGKKILIVDDNTTSLEALTNLARSWKISPVSANSGRQSLEILSGRNDFNLVLIDIDMPEMNGIELAKLIRIKYPSIPLVAMTRTGDEKHKEYIQFFSSQVSKPVRHQLLKNTFLQVITKPSGQANAGLTTQDFSSRFPLRILIVEDNIINQKIATKILGKLGYDPAIANNGKEAIEMVSQEHYDVILMDVQMPEMDGMEATRMIRTCIETQPVIIAMTANVMQGDRNDCMQSGMDDYMSKPIDLKELLFQLEKWSHVIREKKKIAALDK
jgi:signal transduction histidine kinase/DNA-binding response OmpR family regulator